jgi:membrane protein required for colicin V production
MRGAVRELVAMFAFTLAAIASVFLLPVSGPIARHSIRQHWAANGAAIVLTFLIVYILVRLLGGWLSKALQSQSTLGTLDRGVGLGFGVVRALVLLGAFYLVFNGATPAYLVPTWISDGALYPLSRVSGQALQAVAPKGLHAAGGFGRVLQEKALNGGNADEDATAGDQALSQTPPDEDTSSLKRQRAGKSERKGLHVLVEPD